MNTLLLKSRSVSLFLVATLALFAVRANAGWKVGDVLPDLSAHKLEGKLPELKGKVVLVDFWASWCLPCAKSFPAMDELYQKYKDRGLVVVAVSVDDKSADMEKFLKKHSASFPVVRDAAHSLVAAADVSTMPTSFIVDREGKVRFVHTGFRGEETKKQYVEQIESLVKGAP